LMEGVDTISVYAFSECSALTEINFPKSLTTIAYYAFYRAGSLHAVTLPENVSAVGSYAFAECPNLTELTLLSEKIGFGTRAFDFNQPDIKPIFTIYGYEGSYAEKLAKKSDIAFVAIDRQPEPEPEPEIPVVPDEPDDTDDVTTGDADTTEPPAAEEKGDMNGDGKLNVSDVSKLAAHIKGVKSLSEGVDADINGDGKTNVTDLSKVAAHVKGIKKMN